MGYEDGEKCLGTRKALAEMPALFYQLCDLEQLARPLGASVSLVSQIWDAPAHAVSLSHVQLFVTSSVHGIFQARTLEWVAIPFSRGSSQPRDLTWVFCNAGSLSSVPPGMPQYI